MLSISIRRVEGVGVEEVRREEIHIVRAGRSIRTLNRRRSLDKRRAGCTQERRGQQQRWKWRRTRIRTITLPPLQQHTRITRTHTTTRGTHSSTG